jgi:hypothetical protein
MRLPGLRSFGARRPVTATKGRSMRPRMEQIGKPISMIDFIPVAEVEIPPAEGFRSVSPEPAQVEQPLEDLPPKITDLVPPAQARFILHRDGRLEKLPVPPPRPVDPVLNERRIIQDRTDRKEAVERRRAKSPFWCDRPREGALFW